MVAWQISQLDPRWRFHPKGGGTADLTCAEDGTCIQIKITSGTKILGNRVSKGEGEYVGVLYRTRTTKNLSIEIAEIPVGSLTSDDWDRKEGTQYAFLKREAQAKMRRIYP